MEHPMENVAYDESNVFAKILAGQLPAHKIFETDHVLAILDLFPATPGHALLLPKAKVANITQMSPQVAADFFQELPRLARAVQKATGCPGINIIQNNGKPSGQAVFHVHVHVIPRYENDQLISFPAEGAMIEADNAAEMISKIQSHL